MVDQLFAAWQMCHGYATLTVNPPPSDLNEVWDSTSSDSFTAVMPGWSQTPADVWNLLTVFNVEYASTWVTEAFSGSTTFVCPASDQVWLSSVKEHGKISGNGKHLLTRSGHSGHKFHRCRGAWRPSEDYLTEQTSIYENFKDTYLRTSDAAAALDLAYYQSCLNRPNLTYEQAHPFTPEYIHHMHLTEECNAGLCVDLCWNRTQNHHPGNHR